MKHLYYIRHGKTALNVKNLASGHTETPLTIEGIERALDAGSKMKNIQIHFDVIISSPLDRAVMTAQAIAKHIGYPLERIEKDQRIIERHFGELEAKSLLHDYHISRKEYETNPSVIDNIPGVEKAADLQARADAFFEYIKMRPEDTILLVGHSSFARALIRAIEHIPANAHIKPLDNTTLTKLI